jgi:hypothetical protein
MHAQRERPGWDSVQARNEAMKDVFTRCSKKMAVQVCTVIIICSFSCKFMCSCNMLAIPYVQGNLFIIIIILIGVYFSQVKNKP